MVKRYGLAFDLERCIGCNTCTIACKLENNLNKGSGIRVHTIGGLRDDTPAGTYPNLSMHFRPLPCMHCEQPACMEACPSDAIYKRADGIVLVDNDKCIGCQNCIEACPYGVLLYDESKNIVWKCTLCAPRLDQGLEPFCQICCENEAIYSGNLLDNESSISKLITSRKAVVLKPEAGTIPSTYYCPTRAGKV